jgi:hypothetical protein
MSFGADALPGRDGGFTGGERCPKCEPDFSQLNPLRKQPDIMMCEGPGHHFCAECGHEATEANRRWACSHNPAHTKSKP